jgi:hypothetical protein
MDRRRRTGPGGRRRRTLVAVAALLLAGWPRALAQSGFGAPVNVSQSPGPSFLPALTVDPVTGRGSLFWHDFSSSPNLLWCAAGGAGAWDPAAPCPVNRTQSWNPQAVLDRFGCLHLAWRDRSGGQDDILYARFDGTAWTVPDNLSQSAGRSDNPALAVDPDGRPHVLWEDNTSGLVRFHEAHHDGTGWSAAADTGLPFVQGTFLDTIECACDPTGALHAVWEDGATTLTEVYHARRPPGGPWDAPEVVSSTPLSASVEPHLAVGGDGTLHAVWVEQEARTGNTFEVVHATRPASGGGWGPAVDVSRQGGNCYEPTVAVDPVDGVARIAWMLAEDGDIHFVAAPGAAPVNVSRSAALSERPALALDAAGVPTIAWEEVVGTGRDIFVATPAATVPILLKAVADRLRGDVVLGWSGGEAPWLVRRSLTPDVAGSGNPITPPGGTATAGWVDPGVLADPTLYFYDVAESR